MGHHQELQPRVDEPSLASKLHRGLMIRPNRKIPQFATFLQKKPPSLLTATPSPGWLVGWTCLVGWLVGWLDLLGTRWQPVCDYPTLQASIVRESCQLQAGFLLCVSSRPHSLRKVRWKTCTVMQLGQNYPNLSPNSGSVLKSRA